MTLYTHKECEPTCHSQLSRFWNTRDNKNEKQLTPAGIYVSCPYIK